jgi:hypothetical protein
MVQGRMLLAGFEDGRLISLDADNGTILAQADLGEMVACAWQEADGLHGFAGTTAWHWDGSELRREALPFQVLSGGLGIAITNENRVQVLGTDGWQVVGVNREKLVARPLRWGDHAVLTSRHGVTVLGRRPFTVESQADMLMPCVVGDLLAVVSNDGVVRFYAP